ncbi:SPOSA6832_01807, partial [Sporobolomyces salmonicolor]
MPPDISISPQGSASSSHQSHPPRTASTPAASSSSLAALPPFLGPDGKPLHGNALTNAIRGGIRVETANGGERTSRACLACRKLKRAQAHALRWSSPLEKDGRWRWGMRSRGVAVEGRLGRQSARTAVLLCTSDKQTAEAGDEDDLAFAQTRCDGAEDPPCKRCRAGGHECVFVESKRGKRPSRKSAADSSLADKFRMVEKTLSVVLDSIGSGEKPDLTALSQLQASLADGIASDEPRRASVSTASGMRAGSSAGEKDDDGNSPESSDEMGDGPTFSKPRTKRARHGSATTSSGTIFDSPQLGNNLALSPNASVGSNRLPSLPAGNGRPPSRSPSNPSPAGTGPNSLALLADASLAAQIEGRSQLTGLDSTFKLSTVTNAIQRDPNGFGDLDGDGSKAGKTPSVLAKGIVTPELAVELFTIFFDYAYIHLPLLDPAQHTAPHVCATSPFLFTVILAVASRFHSDPTLHSRIYEHAHQCFVDCLSDGERSVEAVQACCILTVWTYPPKGEGDAAGREERPKRAWLYFGMAVRMGLELNLFRPPAFVDAHLSKPGNASKSNPWISLPKDGPEAVTDQEVWDALNRERTWLMVFVIDRKCVGSFLFPSCFKLKLACLHCTACPPSWAGPTRSRKRSRCFFRFTRHVSLLTSVAALFQPPLSPALLIYLRETGVIAHVELQTIMGQVMDTFRDRLYGLSSASDEMPSPVVMKLFNSRMDEWKARWCPMPGEPIANNLLFYFYSSKLFLNTIPLHTMLRNGDASDDPDSVSSTISAAKNLLELGHAYAELSVLRHCPDVNFLLMLYSSVFLVKVRVSNSRFAQLVDSDELSQMLLSLMKDCQIAAHGDPRHAAMTCLLMVRALGASWKALETGGGSGSRSRATSTRGEGDSEVLHGPMLPHQAYGGSVNYHPSALDGTLAAPQHISLAGAMPPSPAPYYQSTSSNPFTNPFAATSTTVTPLPSYRNGPASGAQTPSALAASGFVLDGTGSGAVPGGGLEGVDTFLNDSHFFNSLLVGRGASGFFDWQDTTLPGLDFDPNMMSDPNFAFGNFGFGLSTASAIPSPSLGGEQIDPMLAAGERERKPTM